MEYHGYGRKVCFYWNTQIMNIFWFKICLLDKGADQPFQVILSSREGKVNNNALCLGQYEFSNFALCVIAYETGYRFLTISGRLKSDVDLMWNWLWWSRKLNKRINDHMAMELVRQVLITGQLTIYSGLLICQIVRPIMSICTTSCVRCFTNIC